VTVNYLIWMFIRPTHIIALLAVFGVIFWKTRTGRYCRGIAVVLLVVLGLLPLSFYAIRPLETRFPMPSALEDVDGIIVLAGSEITGISKQYGQTQLNSHGDRLTTFLDLAAAYPDARLVHSGRNESTVAGDLIIGTGVDRLRLMLDDRSQNTCESARNVRELVEPAPEETWLLVTSAFHLPRAMACFRANGWEVTPYPTDYRKGRDPFHFGLITNLTDLDLAAHEWLGLLYYRFRGYTNDLFPAPEPDGPSA
jgi:uncharacterized SAM-binding protein YcdF (DUF218 family)